MAQGQSTLKLKNSKEKDVAGGRKELERMLDHFNIDVNNPINVMTQDSSRQFLQSGSAKVRQQPAQRAEFPRSLPCACRTSTSSS